MLHQKSLPNEEEKRGRDVFSDSRITRDIIYGGGINGKEVWKEGGIKDK